MTVANLPRCLTLEYPPQRAYAMPDSVQLLGKDETWDPSWPVFAASSNKWRSTQWRPVGGDSVDILGHHLPIVRLPAPVAVGDTLVGYGGWPYFENLWVAMLGDRDYDFPVRAVAVRCPD